MPQVSNHLQKLHTNQEFAGWASYITESKSQFHAVIVSPGLLLIQDITYLYDCNKMKPSHWVFCLVFKIQGKNIQHIAGFCQDTWTSAKGASLRTGSKTGTELNTCKFFSLHISHEHFSRLPQDLQRRPQSGGLDQSLSALKYVIAVRQSCSNSISIQNYIEEFWNCCWLAMN